MVKIGIIGCGKIARVRHIPEYAQNKDAQLYGYYDLNIDRAKEMADQYGGRVYASYEEMLRDPAIDAVSVLAANTAHKEITVMALEQGKHVLCEKPMATTLEECQAMVDAAEKTGKYLMIGHNQRLNKTHAKAKRLIEEGAIGKILTFKTSFGHSGPESWAIDGNSSWFFDKKLASFGAMADLGIHKTDLIQFLTGQRVVSVTAIVTTLDKKDKDNQPITVDDNAITIYKMSGGAIGTMTASWTYYGGEDNSTILYGTEGTMKIFADPAHSIVLELRDGSKVSYDVEQIQTNDNQTKSGVIDLFVNCIVSQTPPEISGEEAMAAMKAVFASLESGRTGKTITIEQ